MEDSMPTKKKKNTKKTTANRGSLARVSGGGLVKRIKDWLDAKGAEKGRQIAEQHIVPAIKANLPDWIRIETTSEEPKK
jgi:hypothetical protein